MDPFGGVWRWLYWESLCTLAIPLLAVGPLGIRGQIRGWWKAALAPLYHSIPTKEEVPVAVAVPDRAPSVPPSLPTLLPRLKPPALLPPELPSKANLPFVPEFGEYRGGS